MPFAKKLRRFRIDKPQRFRLSDYDCADTCGLDINKPDAKAMLASGIERLSALQEKLYAENRWSVLVVFQAMDAAGKDGAIKHVMSGVNPQGCEVHSFKQPSAEELDHDFLWRIAKALPERGRIGIFNRSHYEAVLVERVHPEFVSKPQLPRQRIDDDFWDGRFRSIRHFESHLARSGTLILKFFLHMSREEQRKRFLARLEEPGKRWKFEMGDVAERKLWPKYMAAYEDAIRHTSRADARWYVVPADNKWFARLVIAEAIVAAIEELKPEFPKVEGKALKALEQVRGALVAEAPKQK
jgi:PPK2 family polyphosphate:nucleotide phosphotransferase